MNTTILYLSWPSFSKFFLAYIKVIPSSTQSPLPVLDGYENLAKTATAVKVGSTVVKEVNDLNLETKLTQCRAGETCEVEITLANNPSGIYKVTVYGPSEQSDVSGWKVSY